MTKKLLNILLLLTLLLLLSNCNKNNNCPLGQISQKVLPVEEFEIIDIQIPTQVTLIQDTFKEVLVHGNEVFINDLSQEVEDKVWTVNMDACGMDIGFFSIVYTTVNIPEVHVSNSASISAPTPEGIEVNVFKLNLQDAKTAHIRITADSIFIDQKRMIDPTFIGSTRYLELLAKENSSFDGFELETKTAFVKTSSAADIEVNVQDTLIANISGGGNIRYKGTPFINSIITGTGKIIDAN